MDIYLMIAKNVLYDSYCEEGAVESNAYSSFYSNDVLFNERVKKLLKPYGRFEEVHFDKDWHWYTFTINEDGRKLIESGNNLNYEEESQKSNWYEVCTSFVFMGLLCGVIGVFIHGLSDFLGGFKLTLIIRLFQVLTASIIVGFLLIVKSIYNNKHKKRNRCVLIFSAFALVYMIFYESVMEYIIEYTHDYFEFDYDMGGLLMKLQFGCLGTICWFLFCRKYE